MERLLPPTAADLEALAQAALRALPDRLRPLVAEIAIGVEELADEATLAELGLESAWDLTGLYQGVPRTGRGTSDLPRLPDMIVLYRQAILLEWIETGEELGRLVASVLVHELAHHFGFSETDIEAIESDPADADGAAVIRPGAP